MRSILKEFIIGIIWYHNALRTSLTIHRKSVFFNREDVRDLVFKGYITVYRVKLDLKEIEVFGLQTIKKILLNHNVLTPTIQKDYWA